MRSRSAVSVLLAAVAVGITTVVLHVVDADTTVAALVYVVVVVLTALGGYWAGAVRRARVWRTDLHVDLGLTTVSRADVTIAEGRLITKREAIERLPLVGVDPALADQVARRRAGERVVLSPRARRLRARRVRSLVATAIGELLAGP